MALDILQTGSIGFRNEFCIETSIARNERHVHKRTVFLSCGAMEHIALVKRVIKQLGFGDIEVAHTFETALGLNPLEYFSAYINRVARRRVIHAATVDMRFVLQHGGNAGQIIGRNKVVANDSNRDARRTHVLLSATINKAILGHVDGLAQKTR